MLESSEIIPYVALKVIDPEALKLEGLKIFEIVEQ